MTPHTDRLIDSFGRVHNNLRISVTDRCNIRCVYCMPETPEFLPRNQLLSFEEIERFVRIAVPLGIDKIRLTGGEPLVRRDLPRLVEKLASIAGIKDIGLTTNGILLAPLAEALWHAGLRRINVSLDTMDAERFQQLTRRTGFEQVIEGILAAKAAGFHPVKVNAVAMKGCTEEDVIPLAGSPASTVWNCGSSSTCRSITVCGNATKSCSRRDPGPADPGDRTAGALTRPGPACPGH